MNKLEQFTISLFCLVSLAYAGCSDTEIASKWLDRAIKIDGKNTEWEGGTLIKEVNASLAVCNDEHFLYLSLTSGNEALLQHMLMGGLTVWFDPMTGSKSVVGIRYPLPIAMPDMMPPMEEREGEFKPNQRITISLDKLVEFQVLNSDKKVVESLLLPTSKEIALKLGKDKNGFTYELRIPFSGSPSSPLVLATDTAKTIRIGLETSKVEQGPMGPPMGGEGMAGENMGPPPDGDGPPMGGMPPGGRGSGSGKQASLDVWYNVKLSSIK